MSRSALALVPEVPEEQVDPRLDVLVSKLAHDWRPSEWDSKTLTLRVDPTAKTAYAQACRVSGCTKTSLSQHGLCPVCRRHFRQSGEEDLARWLRTAERTTPLRGEQATRDLLCAVAHDGQQCQRKAVTRTQGLCSNHDCSLRRVASRGTEAVAEWWVSARPLEARPPCRATFCDVQQQNRGMCDIHYNRWLSASKPADIDAWLRTQTPVENGRELWLGGLTPLAVHEMLYVMQTRDAASYRLNLTPPRQASRALREHGHESLLELDPSNFAGATPEWLRYAQDRLSLAYRDRDEERRRDIWDLRVLGLHAGRERGTRPLLVDFRPIRQNWLRELSKRWIETGAINRSDFVRDHIAAIAVLSAAIAVGPGNDDPTKLGRADVARFVASLRASTQWAPRRQGKMLGSVQQFLRHARRDGWLERVPGSFGFVPEDAIKHPDADDDDLVGKAIPDHIIQQLDKHLVGLATSQDRRPLGRELTTELRQLAYVLLRDTGRRVSDLAALPLNPVRHDGDEYLLVYDNVKARRRGRHLPIERATADAIDQVSNLVAAAFPTTPRDDLPLFPRATRNPTGRKRVTPDVLSSWFDTWFDELPPLLDDHVDATGTTARFPRERLYCHAFRHSYAQRLADAGTHPDVLRELMDHRTLETSMSYFRVSAKRRREAVDQVASLRIDRSGNNVGGISLANYGRQSVAVPYGNCQEPSNVAAGGKACPIRFQCAGCPHYRPDPSFLPAIETHIAELLTNREEALAAEAADWVIDGIEAELAAYRAIVRKMKDDLAALGEKERKAIEEASVVLRKARAIADTDAQASMPIRRTNLPIVQIGPPPQDKA